jgi:BirA family biotin operon repressor/biotin-[acetyl-CoA-carboxylase] ligase
MRQLEGLSLVVGLAVLQALRNFGVPGAGLKWPNDVLVGNKKIAGILLELVGDPADVCHVVLGIGVNVNMQVADEVDQQWTSIRLESGRSSDRNALVVELSKQLSAYIQRHQVDGFSALQSEWEANHLWQDRSVSLIAGSNHVDGVVLGIDSQGALRLKVSGVEKVFSGGELSLRLRDDS